MKTSPTATTRRNERSKYALATVGSDYVRATVFGAVEPQKAPSNFVERLAREREEQGRLLQLGGLQHLTPKLMQRQCEAVHLVMTDVVLC